MPRHDRDLRRLRRADLIELLEDLSRENDRLRAELAEAQGRLASRELEQSRCGTLAEASLALAGVFEAADEAAQVYVEACRRRAAELGAAPEPAPVTGAHSLQAPTGTAGPAEPAEAKGPQGASPASPAAGPHDKPAKHGKAPKHGKKHKGKKK